MTDDRSRARRRAWTRSEDSALTAAYPHESTAAIATRMHRSLSSTYQRAYGLGLKKSAAYLASPAACRLRRGDQVGWAHRFQKGQAPANKGLRRPGWGPGRMKQTQFKPGVRLGIAAKNWRPVGTILTDSDGYQRIKVREARKGEAYGFGNVRVWPLLQRYVWEQAHGAIPKGYAICFKDGNREHCALENLERVTRRELMARNTVHNLPKPIALAVQLIGAINRQIRKRTHAQQ